MASDTRLVTSSLLFGARNRRHVCTAKALNDFNTLTSTVFVISPWMMDIDLYILVYLDSRNAAKEKGACGLMTVVGLKEI